LLYTAENEGCIYTKVKGAFATKIFSMVHHAGCVIYTGPSLPSSYLIHSFEKLLTTLAKRICKCIEQFSFFFL